MANSSRHVMCIAWLSILCEALRLTLATPSNTFLQGQQLMETALILTSMLVGAAEYSLIYMLGGGGLLGAIVIYFIAKSLHR